MNRGQIKNKIKHLYSVRNKVKNEVEDIQNLIDNKEMALYNAKTLLEELLFENSDEIGECEDRLVKFNNIIDEIEELNQDVHKMIDRNFSLIAFSVNVDSSDLDTYSFEELIEKKEDLRIDLKVLKEINDKKLDN